MNKIRTLLEEIKKSDKESSGMTLYPPADPTAVDELLKGGWTHPLPPSFGDFLRASNGLTGFRGDLDFLSTDKERQEQIRNIVQKRTQQDNIDLRAMFKEVNDSVIAKWEADPENYHTSNHPVIAATKFGGLLFYDSRTRDGKGEMQLSWSSDEDATITQRYDNIEKYFEAVLEEARKSAGAEEG